jgi:arginyl-tRNA synthetase
LRDQNGIMGIVSVIQAAVISEISSLYSIQADPSRIQVTETKPEFEGDYTVVLFALTKELKRSPEAIGNELGEALTKSNPYLFPAFNVIKGFLNLSLGHEYWLQFLEEHHDNPYYGFAVSNGQRIMVEYSSPNTNKPLHLGHLRNNFLGWSVSEIYKANGFDVIKTCIVNDRGVHICKSMLAWQKFGNGETPLSTGKKGDHLVGDYYVQFENELKRQAEPLIETVLSGNTDSFNGEEKNKLDTLLGKLSESVTAEKKAEARAAIVEIVRNNTPIMKEVRMMLLKWEEGDPETMNLWRQMNGWVYEGFDQTYLKIGSDFDKVYYESETYLLGKQFVEHGVTSGLFTRRADGSVWIDLTADGLDEKLLLRKDGTSVYMTQDLGLVKQKYEDYAMQESIYVVGDEQNYHLKVLKLISQKLQLPNADGIYHLSYGMVELPSGRMKSREGTVVDADDIIDEMENISAQHTKDLGKVDDFTTEELQSLYHVIGLGALKFFLLRVDPKKRMIFNPEESIDFHGFTGPFIQYTYARTRSILRKELPQHNTLSGTVLSAEKNVLKELEKYPEAIEQAKKEMNPSVIANYVFTLAQSVNSFVTELRILKAESEEKKELRLQLAQMTAHVIKSAMGLLGISVPERM